MKRLEDEPHALAAKRRQRVVVKRRELQAIELDRTFVGAIEARDEIQQRRLADARLAHDCDIVADGELQAHIGKDCALPRPGIGLGQAMDNKHGRSVTRISNKGRLASKSSTNSNSAKQPRQKKNPRNGG